MTRRGMSLVLVVWVWFGCAAAVAQAQVTPGLIPAPVGQRALAFAPDGKTLAAGSYRTVTLYDLATKKDTAKLGETEGDILTIAFSPDGKLLAAAGAKGKVRVWEVEGGKLAHTLDTGESEVWAVRFSPDGKTLGAVTGTGARVWDLAGEKELRTVKVAGGAQHGGDLSADLKFLAIAPGAIPSKVQWWAVTAGKQVKEMGAAGAGNYPISLWGNAVVSPDGKCIAGAGMGPTLVFDVATGAATQIKETTMQLAFSGDGRLLAAGSWDAAKADQNWLLLCDVKSRRTAKVAEGVKGVVRRVALSADGKLLAATADKTEGIMLVDTSKAAFR